MPGRSAAGHRGSSMTRVARRMAAGEVSKSSGPVVRAGPASCAHAGGRRAAAAKSWAWSMPSIGSIRHHGGDRRRSLARVVGARPGADRCRARSARSVRMRRRARARFDPARADSALSCTRRGRPSARAFRDWRPRPGCGSPTIAGQPSAPFARRRRPDGPRARGVSVRLTSARLDRRRPTERRLAGLDITRADRTPNARSPPPAGPSGRRGWFTAKNRDSSCLGRTILVASLLSVDHARQGRLAEIARACSPRVELHGDPRSYSTRAGNAGHRARRTSRVKCRRLPLNRDDACASPRRRAWRRGSWRMSAGACDVRPSEAAALRRSAAGADFPGPAPVPCRGLGECA
jgi:hypothetical protein